MRNISISLDDPLFEQVERAAHQRGRDVNGFVMALIEDNVGPTGGGHAILGMFGDEPELAEAVCERAMRARERDPLRTP